MPKYVFAYHGGKMPTSAEEGAKLMAEWTSWFAKLGPAVIDGGNPVGPSTTVSSNGVDNNGGANPISGYSLISADSMDTAVEMAKQCPILAHGSVEIAEAIDMGIQ